MNPQKNISFEPSRRQFFTGKVSNKTLPYRPPWAVSETIFDDTCTNCGKCIDVCPTHILSFGRGRLPVVSFIASDANNIEMNVGINKGECTFCGQCEAVCEPNALFKKEQQAHQEDIAPWDLTITIDESCLSTKHVMCRSCGDNCETEAIQFQLELGGKATPHISYDDCTGCGACIAPCPTQSINISRKSQI